MVQIKKDILIVDISGRVELYDDALAEALAGASGQDSISLLRPGKGLLSLVPARYKNSEALLKRLVKAVEGLINYFYLSLICVFRKVDILHLQWLPFMEVNEVEIPILRFLKKLSPQVRILLTIHNVFPHNISENGRILYAQRFVKLVGLIDGFIVHTETSKADVIREFSLPEERVSVCCHGVFVPAGVTPGQADRRDGKLNVLMFGNQSYYKGTDIFVDAVCAMDENHGDRLDAHIIGEIPQQLYQVLKGKDKSGRIKWTPHFIADEILYNVINGSDLIVLPYREISQSGVLLLSIFFEKKIICSDEPSFVETMRGGEGDDLDRDLFFRSGEPGSLRELLERYLDDRIDGQAICNRLRHLKQLYSWESAARCTLDVYGRIS